MAVRSATIFASWQRRTLGREARFAVSDSVCSSSMETLVVDVSPYSAIFPDLMLAFRRTSLSGYVWNWNRRQGCLYWHTKCIRQLNVDCNVLQADTTAVSNGHGQPTWCHSQSQAGRQSWLFSFDYFGLTVHRCMQRKAPQYLVDCCTPSSDIAINRQRRRSASRRQLDVPRHYRNKFGRRAFSSQPRRLCRLELSTSLPLWPVAAEFWLLQADSKDPSLHGIPVTLAH